jgi:CxxC motif-containing protein
MDRMITCIGCPLGCEVSVSTENGNITAITGYSCKKGEEYARAEVTDPRRTLTTTMRLSGEDRLIPVKSSRPVKKALLFDCMKEINKQSVKAPVEIGDVLIHDILGTGADIVAAGRAAKV